MDTTRRRAAEAITQCVCMELMSPVSGAGKFQVKAGVVDVESVTPEDIGQNELRCPISPEGVCLVCSSYQEFHHSVAVTRVVDPQ